MVNKKNGKTLINSITVAIERYGMFSIALLLAIAFFIIDLLIPLGVAVGVSYVLSILLSKWFPDSRQIIAIVLISLALTVIGYYFSPEGGLLWMILSNRGLGLLAIISTGSVIYIARKGDERRMAAGAASPKLAAELSFEDANLGYRGLVAILLVLMLVVGITFGVVKKTDETRYWVSHTHKVEVHLVNILSALQDAETGQRGYLLSLDESYLEPFRSAEGTLKTVFYNVQKLTIDNPNQQERLLRLTPKITEKMGELGETILLAKTGRSDEALKLVKTNVGKDVMDQIRVIIAEMTDEEAVLLEEREHALKLNQRLSLIAYVVCSFLIVLISAVVMFRYMALSATRRKAEDDLRVAHDVLEVEVGERTQAMIKQKELELSLNQAQRVARMGSWSLDLRSNHLFWSNEIFKIFGNDQEVFEASLEAFFNTIHPDDLESVQVAYQNSVEDNAPYDIDHRIIRQDNGEVRWVHEQCVHQRNEAGDIIKSNGTVQDITERKQAQAEIERLAITDQLTNLANRHQFNTRFSQSLALAKREKKKIVLLFLDLDKFKPINDTFGHPVGDAVLKQAADIFTQNCRETDIVARLGGDEFAILLVHPDDDKSVEIIAGRIIAQIGEPMDIMGHEVRIGTSIGISVFPDNGENEEELISKADLALYEAKKQGRNCFQFYRPALET